MNDLTFFQTWGLAFQARRNELDIAGSPYRCRERFVFSDTANQIHIAEAFPAEKKERQIRISWMLEFLSEAKLPVTAYRRTQDGNFGLERGDAFWQVRQWSKGEALSVDRMASAGEIGRNYADFLIHLRNATISFVPEYLAQTKERPFRFSRFFHGMEKLVEERAKSRKTEIFSLMESVGEFCGLEPCFPRFLAHGDYHPLNVLLHDAKISSVVDWEFSGVKCAGYDAALMLGCMGINSPELLQSEMADIFRTTLRDAAYLHPVVRKYFPDMVVCLRLCWLGEWIEVGDEEMIQREIDYIHFLRGAADLLRI